MIAQFKIESIFKLSERNRVVVFAQLTGDNNNFELTEKSTLGNVAIENWFDIPRKIDEDGNPRADLFAFVLKENNDKSRLEIGQIADLVT